eukprot:m.115310 g.115310  ORF g.115310 m.115310 type:complete len:155 (+) comp37542_c0_seq6:948-1412(+)
MTRFLREAFASRQKRTMTDRILVAWYNFAESDFRYPCVFYGLVSYFEHCWYLQRALLPKDRIIDEKSILSLLRNDSSLCPHKSLMHCGCSHMPRASHHTRLSLLCLYLMKAPQCSSLNFATSPLYQTNRDPGKRVLCTTVNIFFAQERTTEKDE